MKLATLKDGTRDGQLIVVSRDLHTAAIADAIAPTMQRVPSFSVASFIGE
jgi:fumarylacetoacetate (FAA) hydrolase